MTIEATGADSQPISQPITQRSRQPITQRSWQPPQTILDRLKLETAAEHAAIEGATGVMDPNLDLDAYRSYLARTFGFYRVVEDMMCRAWVWEELGLSTSARLKLPLLLRDLDELGVIEPLRLPECDAPPEWPSLAEAVGGAYVLEGSTLGGRVIARHVRQRLGEDVPRHFLEGYWAQTGEYWQDFRASLLVFASSEDIQDRVIAGAKSTFNAFNRWLTASKLTESK